MRQSIHRPAALAILAAVGVVAVLAAFPRSVPGELTQRGGVRVGVDGNISPKKLPRRSQGAVSMWMTGTIGTVDGSQPPDLRTIDIDLNRGGGIFDKGLATCGFDEIDQTTTADARQICRSSLIGDGYLTTSVSLPEQAPFPSNGELLAFNSRDAEGHRVILTHVYGDDPGRATYVLPWEVTHLPGLFATRLHADFPPVVSGWGYISSFRLRLQRRYRTGGKVHSYLTASCPAPKPLPGGIFALARVTFGFAGGLTISTTLDRDCGVAKDKKPKRKRKRK